MQVDHFGTNFVSVDVCISILQWDFLLSKFLEIGNIAVTVLFVM
jgi:hypothetical protein